MKPSQRDPTRLREVAAELYKAMIQTNALHAGGLPDAMWLKSCARWCWDAAATFLDADDCTAEDHGAILAMDPSKF
jgi:hypothetical protein